MEAFADEQPSLVLLVRSEHEISDGGGYSSRRRRERQGPAYRGIVGELRVG
jgi:hypothetical protein